MQINYCDWFAWCMVTAVTLLLLLNDKCKPESLQRDGRPGWRFPQTAGCKARTCFDECVIVTVNDMIRIFYKSKWTSWHSHVKKNWCMCCDRKARAESVQDLNFWTIKHRVYYLEAFCNHIVPPLTEHDDVIETQTQGRTQGGGLGLGLTPPLQLDILRKVHYLRKGD